MMKQLLNKIAYIGIDETVEPSEIKYVTLLNILALISSLLSLGFLPLLIKYLPESRMFLLVWIAGAPFPFIVLSLNYFKCRLMARICFNLYAVILFITLAVLGGRNISMHSFLILVIIASFFIYPPDKKHFMYTIILVALGSFIGLETWFLNHKGILDVSPGLMKESSFTVNIALTVYILGFSFYIYTIYLRAEEKSESLLHNILPVKIANRLKLKQQTIADGFNNCTVLFADIVEFTRFSENITPKDLVTRLNDIFSTFDDLVDKYGLEKIKTIGDAYMVVAGLPEPQEDHAVTISELALDMKDAIRKFEDNAGNALQLRIGINSGPVVAGVIGKKKFIYDLWGDTVNIAARMESHGVPGEIQTTQHTYELLKNKYIFTERGRIDVKGKGRMQTYLLQGRLNQ